MSFRHPRVIMTKYMEHISRISKHFRRALRRRKCWKLQMYFFMFHDWLHHNIPPFFSLIHSLRLWIFFFFQVCFTNHIFDFKNVIAGRTSLPLVLLPAMLSPNLLFGDFSQMRFQSHFSKKHRIINWNRVLRTQTWKSTLKIIRFLWYRILHKNPIPWCATIYLF